MIKSGYAFRMSHPTGVRHEASSFALAEIMVEVVYSSLHRPTMDSPWP